MRAAPVRHGWLGAGMALLGIAIVAGCADGPPADGDAVAPDRGPHPRGIATGMVEGIALAGDAALIARVEAAKGGGPERVTVTRIALAGPRGGSPKTLPWPASPRGGLRVLSMDASPRVLGLTVTTADDEEGGEVSGLFGGAATGPVRALEPVRAGAQGTPVARTVQADDGRLFVSESEGHASGVERFTVRVPGAADRPVDLPAGAQWVTFAGDLVAYALMPRRSQRATGRARLEALLPRRVVVREWQTGARRATFSVPGGITGLAISRAGAVAAAEFRGGVLEHRAGRLRRITRSQPAGGGVTHVYAGERLVLVRRRRASGPEHLVIAEPGGRTRPFGVPALRIGALAADERRVLWGVGPFEDGCVVVAGIRAAAAQTIPAGGPCTRTVVNFEVGGASQGQLSQLRAGRRVGLTIECVAAPPPGCRGEVRVLMDFKHDASAPVPFAVAPGAKRRLVARLTADGAARVVDGGGHSFTLAATAVDPDGRRSQHRGDLSVQRSPVPKSPR